MRIKIREHKVEPLFRPHRHEREIFGAKSLHSLNLCGADQRAVQAVGPAVIAAAKKFARSAAFCRRTRAMPAHVVEAPQLAVEPTHKHQRLTQQICGEVVPGGYDLARMSNHLPSARKDFSLLRGKHARLRI